MLSLYPALKAAHLTLVAASGGLFALRGAARLVGARWPLRRRWRALSVAIDTLLLGAGAALWWLLAIDPRVQTWLGVKLGLLLVYIVLGAFALRHGRTAARRAACYAAALAVYLFMVGVALRHHPLGWLAG